jgi:hypothetical protein
MFFLDRSGSRPFSTHRLLGFVSTLVFVCAAAPAARAAVTLPVRGSIAVSILLCYPSDSPKPSKGLDFFKNMLSGASKGDVGDYYISQSRGLIDFNATTIKGWYKTNETLATYRANAPRNLGKSFIAYQDCQAAAKNSKTDPYVAPAGQPELVIFDPAFDEFGSSDVAMIHDDSEVGARMHEFGHALGLNHTRSWNKNEEYADNWDVMSYAQNWGASNGTPPTEPTHLSAFELERLGWLARGETTTVGGDGRTTATYTLQALETTTPGLRGIRVPVDPNDPLHYIEVEYREKIGLDASIPAATVLFEDIKYDTEYDTGSGAHNSYRMYTDKSESAPLTQYDSQGVEITTVAQGDHAQVSVQIPASLLSAAKRNFGAMTCKPGYVWREADGYDFVCVDPSVRARARTDNAQAAAHAAGAPGSLCKQGYVWREAFPGDRVCTTPDVRAQARADNAAAKGRVTL